MSSSQDFVILEDDVDHEKFVRFARRQGLEPHHTHPIGDDSAYFEDVWITPDRKNAVHYVDDPRYEARFLWVRGPNHRGLLHEASKYLAFYDDEELIVGAGDVTNLGEAMRAVFRVGIAFPQYRPDAYQVFQAYLQHSHPGMREAAIKAIAYHAWPETQPLLAEVVENDPDAEVREYAKPILDGLREKFGDRR